MQLPYATRHPYDARRNIVVQVGGIKWPYPPFKVALAISILKGENMGTKYFWNKSTRAVKPLLKDETMRSSELPTNCRQFTYLVVSIITITKIMSATIGCMLLHHYLHRNRGTSCTSHCLQ